MARALPTKVAFVLNAIAITTALAVISDYFPMTTPLLGQLMPSSSSQVQFFFAEVRESYFNRE